MLSSSSYENFTSEKFIDETMAPGYVLYYDTPAILLVYYLGKEVDQLHLPEMGNLSHGKLYTPRQVADLFFESIKNGIDSGE